ncbi:MAG: hypothetical protein LBU32_06275 [Clostridiales bacterium]|nr:hypothetical protein [Clostridiales bacterium]
MAECPKRSFNASRWEELKPAAVEAETKIDKFGKSAYVAGFYISSLDGVQESALGRRKQPAMAPGRRLGAGKSQKPEKGLRPSSRH